MKKISLFSLALLSSLALASAAPKNTAPVTDSKADALAKKIEDAIKSNAVSQQDGEELTRSLARIQKKDAEAQRLGRMNPRTLKADNAELDKIDKALTRKEKQQTAAAAAAAAASASPTP